MSLPAKEGVVLRDFQGLVNNADKLDLPPGAAIVQTNLLARIEGELTVRRGIREVRFEST